MEVEYEIHVCYDLCGYGVVEQLIGMLCHLLGYCSYTRRNMQIDEESALFSRRWLTVVATYVVQFDDTVA